MLNEHELEAPHPVTGTSLAKRERSLASPNSPERLCNEDESKRPGYNRRQPRVPQTLETRSLRNTCERFRHQRRLQNGKDTQQRLNTLVYCPLPNRSLERPGRFGSSGPVERGISLAQGRQNRPVEGL